MSLQQLLIMHDPIICLKGTFELMIDMAIGLLSLRMLPARFRWWCHVHFQGKSFLCQSRPGTGIVIKMCGLMICVLWLIGYNILTSFCGEAKSTFFSIRMNGRKTMWRCNLLTIRQIGLCLVKRFANLNERRESEHNGKQKENRWSKSQQEIKDGVELPDGGALKFFEGLTVHPWKKNFNNQIQVLGRSIYISWPSLIEEKAGQKTPSSSTSSSWAILS